MKYVTVFPKVCSWVQQRRLQLVIIFFDYHPLNCRWVWTRCVSVVLEVVAVRLTILLYISRTLKASHNINEFCRLPTLLSRIFTKSPKNCLDSVCNLAPSEGRHSQRKCQRVSFYSPQFRQWEYARKMSPQISNIILQELGYTLRSNLADRRSPSVKEYCVVVPHIALCSR